MTVTMMGMESSRRSVLLVGFGETEVRHILSFLGSFDMDLHYLPWSEGLAGLLKMREFDAVVLYMPSDRRQLATALDALRGEDAPNRHTGVILVGAPKRVGAARSYLRLGVNRVLTDQEAGEGLREALMPLLDVAHRFHLRAPVELEAMIDTRPTTAFCHTENLSISGMLVSCAEPLPVGSPVSFSLLFPGDDGPIKGTARVVRLTNPRREHVLGMGAAFVSFADNHRSRLRSLLLQQAS